MTDYAARITALEAAVGQGVLTVETDGQRVTYRSMDDLLKALTYFRAQAAQAGGAGSPVYGATLATFGAD